MTQFFKLSTLRAALALGVLALGAAAPAQAIVYDFKMYSGASADLAWTGSHLFVDVTEDSTTAANDVLFKFTNELPTLTPLPGYGQPTVSYFWFDTGAYSSLFSGISVTATSGVVNLVPRTPTSHPYLPANFAPDYKFGLSTQYPLDNGIYGVGPGESAVMTAMLGAGQTFADVSNALSQGANAATATTGLRIGLLAYALKGTGRDDAGYINNSIVAVPEAETWALMLAGLGLVGFVAHRRKV
jgi:hypothetical protein